MIRLILQWVGVLCVCVCVTVCGGLMIHYRVLLEQHMIVCILGNLKYACLLLIYIWK